MFLEQRLEWRDYGTRVCSRVCLLGMNEMNFPSNGMVNPSGMKFRFFIWDKEMELVITISIPLHQKCCISFHTKCVY